MQYAKLNIVKVLHNIIKGDKHTMNNIQLAQVRGINQELAQLSDMEVEVLVKALQVLEVNAGEFDEEFEMGYSNLEQEELYNSSEEYDAYSRLIFAGWLKPVMDDESILVHLTNKSYSNLDAILDGAKATGNNVEEQKVYSSDYDDYKFPEDKIVGYFVRKNNVTANDVETIIVNALEGGSDYWCGIERTNIIEMKPKGIPYSTWIANALIEGEAVMFHDIEDEQEKFTLTLDKLIKGIELNAQNRSWDSDIHNGDASTADSILQYALFGELVYG